MRVLLSTVVGVMLFASAATPASAQTAADKADTRCVLALVVVGRDPKEAAQARQGMFYFLGKLEARGSTPKLEALMASESKLMNTAPLLQAELTRCGGELTRRANALGAMFQRLQAANKPPQPPAPAAK